MGGVPTGAKRGLGGAAAHGGMREPAGLQQVTSTTQSKAFAQYQEELGRLARLGETVTHQTASALQRQMQAMMHETQLAA